MDRAMATSSNSTKFLEGDVDAYVIEVSGREFEVPKEIWELLVDLSMEKDYYKKLAEGGPVLVM